MDEIRKRTQTGSLHDLWKVKLKQKQIVETHGSWDSTINKLSRVFVLDLRFPVEMRHDQY